MPAQTLSLGQAGYQLLDVAQPTGVPATPVNVTQRGTTASRIFDIRNQTSGQEIVNLGIGMDSLSIGNVTTTANVYESTKNLSANLGDGADTLNLFGNATAAFVSMDLTDSSTGGKGDLLNAQKSFTDSTASTGAGDDTIRIGGSANNSTFYLGEGNNNLYVAGASQGVYASGGSGADKFTFVGAQTDALAFGGGGNDAFTFTGGLTGSDPALSAFVKGSAGIDAGLGDDTIVFGTASNSSNFFISTGGGSDVLQLNGGVSNGQIWLGGQGATTAGRDNVSMTSGSFSSSTLASNNTLGDTIVFGAEVGSSVFAMGSGADSLVFGGGFFDSSVSLGYGADTLTFGVDSYVGSSTFDLGGDANADVISFLGSSTYTDLAGQIVITGAGAGDILYIGATAYNYNTVDNTWYNGSATISFV